MVQQKSSFFFEYEFKMRFIQNSHVCQIGDSTFGFVWHFKVIPIA